LEQSLLENFQFANTTVTAKDAGDLSFAKDWSFNKVIIEGTEKKTLTIVNSTNVSGLETAVPTVKK
jgi:hypothetical protein